MADLFDYAEWRGDVPFSVDPFNEVDSLLLCELTYFDYTGIVPAGADAVPIGEVCRAIFAMHKRIEFLGDLNISGKAALLLEKIAGGTRFKNTRMSNFLYESNPGKEFQISAVTFSLEDGTTYAAFRGTDGSIVGWKEDFDITFLDETPGQRRAVRYLNEIRGTGLLRVGGHSKGGNLALYAAAFCEDQDRIMEVYTFDGPGYRGEVTQKEGYRRIIPKVIRIVPEQSVFGLLLTHHTGHRVVKSSGAGLLQHDGFNWSVRRNRFEQTELSRISILIDEALGSWLEKNDDRERELFIDSLFSLFESTGKEKFRDLKDEKLKSAEAMIAALLTMPKDRQQESLRILGELRDSGRQVFRSYMNKKQQGS